MACQTLSEHFFVSSLPSTIVRYNPRRLLPRPGKVAGLAKMFVDNLLILRNGRVVAPPAEKMREASHPSKQ
jgi:hypothetical protein